MTATEPAPVQAQSGDDGMRVLYWVIGIAVLALMVIGLVTYSGKKSTEEAQAKAATLTQKFRKAGLPVPQNQDILVRAFGTDGGAVCANPANALGKAIQNDMLTNGADFVGRRPVIVDRRILVGEVLILQTYCPDKLKPYQDRIDQLKTDNTIKF